MEGIPIRTCVACRRADEQRALVRLSARQDTVVVDPGSRRCGRGAYLCPRPQCFEVAVRREGRVLRRALRRPQVRIDEQLLRRQWAQRLTGLTNDVTAGTGERATASAVRSG